MYIYWGLFHNPRTGNPYKPSSKGTSGTGLAGMTLHTKIFDHSPIPDLKWVCSNSSVVWILISRNFHRLFIADLIFFSFCFMFFLIMISIPGWWLGKNPSEKWWASSIGMKFATQNIHGKNAKFMATSYHQTQTWRSQSRSWRSVKHLQKNHGKNPTPLPVSHQICPCFFPAFWGGFLSHDGVSPCSSSSYRTMGFSMK